jgi:hypothetical protein
MEEEKKVPTPEEIQKQLEEQKKKQEEAIKILKEKIERVGKEIGDILEREGLDLYVDHEIRIVPQRRR